MIDLLINKQKYSKFHTFTWKFIDAILPPFCCHCGIFGVDFCPDCSGKIIRLPQDAVCSLCGNPVDQQNSCARHAMHSGFRFMQARSWGEYKGPLKTILKKIKYDREFGLIRYLTTPISEYIQNWGVDIDMIIPVPLGKKRLFQRGYNQSELIAKPVAYMLDIPIRTDVLHRDRETRSQVGLSLDQRKENVSGAFTADENLCQGKSVMLFDDITTTFSTLNACVSALIRAGAKEVFCFTVARTIYQQEKEKK